VFGRPQDIAAGNVLLTAWQGVTKGYTNHEHLNEQQLIHMNGRVYDYNLGRFMSVDPFIQSPGDSQSLNPYSYLMNNPMAGTDPTGYCAAATGSHIKDCGDLKVEVKVDGKTVGSTVVKDVNFKNGADVSSAMSKGAAQIGQAISDVGNQQSIAKRQNGNNQSATSGRQKGDFRINEHALREMIADPDTYGAGLANVAGSHHDDELRDILGGSYGSFRSELENAFNAGWDKTALAKSIMAPGFMASRGMGLMQALGGYTRSSIIRQQIQSARTYTRPNGAMYHEVSPTRLIVSENHIGDISKALQSHNGNLNLFNKNFWQHVLPHRHIYDAAKAPSPKANMRKAFEKAGAEKTTVWPWE
jgi:RHS repeat-associated protein